MFAVSVKETLQHIHASVSGKAQMTDASVLFLFYKIIENTILGIQVRIDIHLAYIVEKVKIKVFHLTLLQLLFKDLFHLVHVGKIIARKF